MLLSAVLQVSTVLVAVLTIVWHQTRTVDSLRREVRSDHKHLLRRHTKATRQARKDNERLRREFMMSHGKLCDAVIQNSRKLDRIAGFLGIGMPEAAAGRALGATRRSSQQGPRDPPEPSDDRSPAPRPEADKDE